MEIEKILDAWSAGKMCVAIKDFETCTEEEYEECDPTTFDKVEKDSEWMISEIKKSELFEGFEVILINITNKDEIFLPAFYFEQYMKIAN